MFGERRVALKEDGIMMLAAERAAGEADVLRIVAGDFPARRRHRLVERAVTTRRPRALPVIGARILGTHGPLPISLDRCRTQLDNDLWAHDGHPRQREAAAHYDIDGHLHATDE